MTDPLEALESLVNGWRHEWSAVADEPLLTHRPSISNRHADELEPIIQQLRQRLEARLQVILELKAEVESLRAERERYIEALEPLYWLLETGGPLAKDSDTPKRPYIPIPAREPVEDSDTPEKPWWTGMREALEAKPFHTQPSDTEEP